MMIKVSNEFLDFDDDIEVEKQIKLFEDISTTDGDFSYAFDLPKTLHNTKLLQNPFPDNISKPVYQQIPAKLLGDSGAELYDGYLRVERVTNVYSCSFFAGNNNWFAMITGLLSDLDLSRYDIEQTRANVENSWIQTEGVVFPLVDNGGLITRSHPHLKIEDLVGGFYIKTIFNQIFVEAGIKIQGELLNDWMYNNVVCIKNSKSQTEIDARSSSVKKTTLQTVVEAPAPADVITWDNDFTYPYFDGSANNFSLVTNRYTADIRMILKVTVFLVARRTTVDLNQTFHGFIFKNGTDLIVDGFGPLSVFGGETNITLTALVPLDAGEYVDIRGFGGSLSNNVEVVEGTVTFTPTFVYKTFGKAAVPNWTKQEFVSNVLKLFNVLASYNEGDATLTLNLFEKIKSKPAVDLSEYISETEVDYSEFISDYGQRSKLSYNEVEFKELKDNNVGKFFKYGQGVIDVDNDFLEPDVDIIESDFSNPIAYINGVFDMSMERTNLIELDEGENLDFTGVSDDGGGDAVFAIPEDIFFPYDLVRITDSTNPVYNGDWVVSTVNVGSIELQGIGFDTNATGTITKLDYTYANSDDVYLFVNIPNYALFNFTDANLRLENSVLTTIAVAYFDLINTGKLINEQFIYSLSFGGIDDPLHYQVTMIEQYFRLFSRVLNDPASLLSIAHLPYALFCQIDFLSPIKVRLFETTNVYYLNRMSGYKESYLPATLHLIKLP